MEENALKGPRIIHQNKVRIRGRILEEPRFTNEKGGIHFYETKLSVYRLSDKADLIPVTLPDTLLTPGMKYEDRVCEIRGQFRSYNRPQEDRVHLKLSVYAREIEFPEEKRPAQGGNLVVRERNPWTEPTDDINEVVVEGYICRPAAIRKTPMGREIADFLLAVPRFYSRSDFIPCIAWGYRAKCAMELPAGTRVLVKGRIQSRLYWKELSNGAKDLRQAFELSVFELYVHPQASASQSAKKEGFSETKYLE